MSSGFRVGKYEVGRKLGEGGFGIIHLAYDLELDREVAMKFLRAEFVTKPAVVERFLQEARSAAKVCHPGIVTVFDCVEVAQPGADTMVYIAMEVCRQVASALGAAHQHGIVHRDLKPDNIHLVPDLAVPGGQRIKVLDFGVAKLTDSMLGPSARTHSAMLLGTPLYMSPEQCRSSADVDGRSDIYALGCILFELLCGRRVYKGDS